MTFENPHWLYLTAILAVILLSLIGYGLRKRDQLLGQFVATRLIAGLSHRAQSGRLLIKGFCSVLAITLIGFALAQPQYGTRAVKRSARGIDLVFAVDCSKSMLAQDLSPHRLQRAKLAVLDLVEQLQGDRIGLVAFAGQAFLQTPLTLDYGAFKESLYALSPSSMSRGGSDIGAALREAAEAFPLDDNFKTLLLLTDGEDLGGDALAAAQELADQSIRVYTIGIGTQAGELLRQANQLGNTITVRDASGKPVLSKLDEAGLRKISQITQANYVHINQVRSDSLHAAIRSVTPSSDRDLEWAEMAIERYQWFLLPAIMLLMLEMFMHRRAAKASLMTLSALMGIGSLAPAPAVAQVLSGDSSQKVAIPAPEQISSISEKFEAAQAAIQAEKFDDAATLYREVLTESKDFSQQADACYNQALIANQQSRIRYQAGDLADALERMQAAELHAAACLEIVPQDLEYRTTLNQITAAKKAIEALIESQEQDAKQEQDANQEQDSNQERPEPGDSPPSEDQSADSDESASSDTTQSSDQSSSATSESAAPPGTQDSQQQPKASDTSTDPAAESEEDGATNESSAEEKHSNSTAEALGKDLADATQATQNPEPNQQASTAGEAAADHAELPAGEPPVGMTEQEAHALLHSLSGQEKILPMIPRTAQQSPQSTRDW